MIDISLIKSRISCVEFAQRNGLPIRYSGDRCVSPLRAGAKNNTSFWVFDDHFTDFGSGQSGDVIDFAAYLLYNGDKGLAIRELAKITGVDLHDTNTAEWINYTQKLGNEIFSYHENLTDDDREYLHRRGIADETINRVKIGRTKNGRLSFPYWKNNYICYYATRSLPGCQYPDRKYMKMPIDEFNDHTIWGLHTIDRDNDTLIIAEGAFDALSFDQENYAVISAITGFFSREQLPTALGIAKTFKRVFLVYDNDKVSRAGEKFTLKMAKILIENRIPCIIGSVPPVYKDVSEYYADGNDLQFLIDDAVDGVEFMASKITDTTEFETFSRRVCRFMTAPQVDLFFNAVFRSNDSFPDSFLKTLQKDCKKAPPDDIVANEILTKHKLLYNPNVSFFEYNGKFWQAKTDTDIENYIRKELSVYATGPRLSSILRVVKASVVTDRLFNTASVVNFINGTLELTDTEPYYLFREHSENDYCTYCLSYPYDSSAYSNDWRNFIETVTEGDGKRMSFLQEFTGYILFTDNRIHKVAVLVGQGSNGKSVFLKTMEKLFGKSNVQHIDAAELGDPFRVIHLQGAMLNISEEVKNDLSSAEAMIKKIASGDELNACHKGKPFINFVPRAKLLLSFNNYPKFTDKSDGISRRLAFIEFPLKFVEIPKLPNERLIDRTLESKFAEQLSGIFNWVLDGYLIVKRDGYITETDEHNRVLTDFKEDSDPTITFVRDLEFSGRCTKFDMYERYKYWCYDNGYKPEPSKSALRLITKHIKAMRKDIEEVKSNGVRGYRAI